MRQIYHNTRRRIHKTSRFLEALAVHLALLAVVAVVGWILYIGLTQPSPGNRKATPYRQVRGRI